MSAFGNNLFGLSEFTSLVDTHATRMGANPLLVSGVSSQQKQNNYRFRAFTAGSREHGEGQVEGTAEDRVQEDPHQLTQQDSRQDRQAGRTGGQQPHYTAQ